VTATFPELAGQHVIVTGAAQGIGRSIALGFARQGCLVTAIDRDVAGLASTAASQSGIYALTCDLTHSFKLERACARAILERGNAAVLVNNAGRDQRAPVMDVTPDRLREMLALNLEHHLLLARQVAPGMNARGGGAIINLSSTAWMKAAPDMVAYHTAKAGIIGMTRGLARDLGGGLIRVNAIAPGRVYTQRARQQTDAAWIEQTQEMQCLPTLIGPEDIANCAVWLASDSARMITGQTIVVDGGVV